MQDKDFSAPEVMYDIDLRYWPSLLRLNWKDIIDRALPLSSSSKKDTIRHVCGKFLIHPILVLGKTIHEQMRDSRFSLKTDEEFRVFISSFANQLSRSGQHFDANGSKMGASLLEYSLSTAFDNDEKLMQEYLSICGTISKRYDIPRKRIETSGSQHNVFKRNEDERIELELPYANNECWQLSASHFGAQENESSIEMGIMASIDMAPSLFQKWGVPFDYLMSNGDVYSAHSGYFYQHSDCSVEITHDNSSYSTYYSHLEINDIENGAFLEQGYNLGRISLDPDTSNCKCNWAKKSFACSTGPHIHFELRRNGRPSDLQGQVISNLQVNTGLLPHDFFCSNADGDCTTATFGGAPCATYYTDLKTGNKICAVTKGSNIGNL